jgi:P27 family predicted phage terminase small subunit
MGKRGPSPKPTNLKVLQGNPGRRKLNENEPVYEPCEELSDKPPAYLSTYAKKEWKRIAPLLLRNGLLTEVDISALAAYCQSYHRWVEAEKLIRTHGYTTTTDKGNIIQRPEVGIANKAMDEMLKYAKEFGLTPSSRSALHIEKQEEVKDPLMEFIRGGRSSG